MMQRMHTLGEHVICATSTATDGNMDFRFGDPLAVKANREQFLSQFGISYNEHYAMRCTHSDTVLVVTRESEGFGADAQSLQPIADACITQEPRIALFLLTADCIPLSLFDPHTGTIALIHCSRKTLCDRLPKKTIAVMRERFGIGSKSLRAHLGPHIRKESYSFPLPLSEVHPLLIPYIEEHAGKGSIDLTSFCIDELLRLGIDPSLITRSPEDTGSDDSFFSHHRAQKLKTPEARIATVLMLQTSVRSK